jgi:hypothetical protein
LTVTCPGAFDRPILIGALALLLAACQPTVRVQAPDKPIEINMNIHIQQEVRVKVERDVDSTIAQNPDLFGVPEASK